MRGRVNPQNDLFVSFVLDEKIPSDHPLRKVKTWCDDILHRMRRDLDAAYSPVGRPGVPPEQLLKALLLQSLYSIPSEIKLMEAIDFNLLYRWFLDLPLDAKVWTPEAFSMNRQRFIDHDLVRKFFDRVVEFAFEKEVISTDHFTVDGTLIRSLASHKSLEPIDGRSKAARDAKKNKDDDDADPDAGSRDRLVNWRGEKLSNDTHRSTTDPEALLARKGPGRPAELSHSGHVLMENRNGICLDVVVDHATGYAERDSALDMLKHVRKRHKVRPKTVGFDAGYDDGQFILDVEKTGATPHVPVRKGAIKATDDKGQARRRARRRMKREGYKVSQVIRKRVEQIIGWLKTTGGWSRTRFVEQERTHTEGLINGTAYNFIRLLKLVT